MKKEKNTKNKTKRVIQTSSASSDFTKYSGVSTFFFLLYFLKIVRRCKKTDPCVYNANFHPCFSFVFANQFHNRVLFWLPDPAQYVHTMDNDQYLKLIICMDTCGHLSILTDTFSDIWKRMDTSGDLQTLVDNQ